MHGKRKKDVKVLSEQERKKSEEQGEKVISMINEFLDLRHGVRQAQNPGEYCNLLASMCPDLPTIYNYKREVMMQTFNKTIDPREQYKLLANELILITSFLKRSPKSYGIWSYRQWLVLECRKLEHLANKLREKAKQIEKNSDKAVNQVQEEAIPKVVEMELKLCNKMLDLDERNFHCWNYRNWLISQVENNSSEYVERELEYTQQKYEKNFSNFSALHFRAKNLERKYLAALMENPHQTELVQFKIPLEILKSEIELIKNAIFIQPNEQGVWLYHKWLLGLLAPFRLISIKSQNPESTILQLTFSTKIRSDNLQNGLALFDQEGEVVSDPVIQIQNGSQGIGQVFTVIAKKQVFKVVLKQLQSCEQHIKESNTNKINLISSTFKVSDSSSSTFQLQEIEEEDQKLEQTANAIVTEELSFVEEIIEAENNCKFAFFHKLFLLQIQQAIQSVLHPFDYSQAISSTNLILETIEKLNPIAKKQQSVLASQTAQYSTLLNLLKALRDGKSSQEFEMPTSPCYEVGVLIPLYSLLND